MGRGRTGLIIAALTAVVIGIGLLVAGGRLDGVDTAVGRPLVWTGDGPHITTLQVLTAPGAENVRIPLLMTITGLLLWQRLVALAAFTAAAALAVAPLTRAIKDLVERPRPSYPGATVTAVDWSWPSGHASGAAVLAGVLLVLLPRYTRRRRALAVTLVLGAVSVAWTRLALGVHSLSDVLAGLALGTSVVLLTGLILRAPLRTRTGTTSAEARRRSPAADR